MKKYNTVVSKLSTPYYISDSDVIEFIQKNSDMEWNTACEFAREHSIISEDGSFIYWDKSDLTEEPTDYNKEQQKWIGAFFKAHPWIGSMKVVFDD